MSDTKALSRLPSATSKDIGQITAIEQARAVAEVQARVIVAQNNPRDVQGAIDEMEEVCQQKLLADRAFYNVPRGGKTLTDVSIHLAKELVRIWGNVDYEVAELRRDDDKGYSEMSAWAWDMQANNKATIKFQVPHTRDMKTGSVRMNDINDIHYLLANMGSRRVREQILKILPTWFVERAKELCYKTIEDGGGVPLPQRIAAALKVFDGLGVTRERIERRLMVKADKWTPHHLAQLTVTHASLHQGTTTVDEEFPPERIEPADLEKVTVAPAPVVQTPAPVTPPPAPAQDEPVDHTPPPAPEGVDMATKGHATNINNLLKKFDYPTGPEGQRRKMSDVSTLAGRVVTTLAQLTAHEANEVITQLGMALETDEPNNALDAVLDAYRTEQNGMTRP